MKNALFTLAAILVSTLALAQTTTENYVKTTSYRVETQDASNNANTGNPLSNEEKIVEVNYFDGLGRAEQSIAVRAGGGQEDIITHYEYDEFGRQAKQYLPYIRQSSSLNFDDTPISNLIANINTYYISKFPDDVDNTNPNPFSETRFETSSLSRVLEQGAPGLDWALDETNDDDQTIKFEYGTNEVDEVKLFEIAFPDSSVPFHLEQPELIYEGTYPVGELYKTITKDENHTGTTKNHTTEEFKDKSGRVILKRTFNEGLAHDTQYVYDDFGNLTFVLSPKGSDIVLTQNVLTNFSQTISGESFLALTSESVATGNAVVSLTGYQLTAQFNMSFGPQSQLKNGPIIQLNQPLPNMDIGTISVGNVLYQLSIQDGYLHLQGSGEVASLTNNFTANVPEYGVDESVIDNLGYQYRYDFRNRLVEKKIPGKDWEFIVYTKLDQPHYTQDANLRAQNSWLFTVYDAYGRVAYTGMDTNNTQSRDVMYDSVHTVQGNGAIATRTTPANTQGGGDLNYTIGPYLTYLDFEELHTVNYYDDYNFDMDGIVAPTNSFGVPVSTNTNSLPTGSKIRVLGTDDWITTVTYYDHKQMPIYVITKNDYHGTIDYKMTRYDFTGKIIETQTLHTKTGNPQINVQNEYTYDHVNRLIKNEQRTNMLECTDEVGIEVNGNTITKTASGNGWDTGFASTGKIITDGFISWSNDKQNSYTAIGLSEHNHSNVGYGNIRYGIYSYSGKLYIYESGSQKFAGDSSNNGLYIDEDVLSIQRDNGVVTYWKNDLLLYTSSTPNTAPLLIDGSIYTSGKSIYNMQLYNDHQELIVKNTYDELGQLESKDVGNVETNPLQNIDYTYNVRGWLKTINDIDNLGSDLFSFKINYNTLEAAGSGNSLYNGNISETLWKTNNESATTRAYQYSYDQLNRLTDAQYSYDWLNTNSSFISANQRYNTYGVSYDKNGNILNLNRRGYRHTTTDGVNDNDILNYSYNSNQLLSVTNASNEPHVGFVDGNTSGDDYTYDANGNMTQDLNKGISSITYNHLNLPVTVSKGFEGSITYTYDAVGNKLRKATILFPGAGGYFSGSGVDYAGNFIYQFGSSSGGPAPGNTTSYYNLKFFSHPEGYVEPDGNGSYNYTYQYRDHLSNIRLSYSDFDGNGLIDTTEILEENNYYPFGLKHTGYNNVVNSTNVGQNFKFNGKELDQDLGLNWYHYGFRVYDATIGRFPSIDPKSDSFPHVSTYNYAENDPVGSIDLWGLQAIDPVNIGYGQVRNQIREAGGNVKEYDEQNFKYGMTGFAAGLGVIVIAEIGIAATATFLLNEAKDEALSQATGGASDVFDITKLAYKGLNHLVKIGWKGLIGKADNVISTGNWIDAKESMSDAAASYQKQITGMDASKSFELNGVKFDGVTENGILLDAKSDMAFALDKNGGFHKWFKGADGLVTQANRQLKAAKGTRIQWKFENKEVMEATQELFKKNDIQGIDLIHTPRQ